RRAGHAVVDGATAATPDLCLRQASFAVGQFLGRHRPGRARLAGVGNRRAVGAAQVRRGHGRARAQQGGKKGGGERLQREAKIHACTLRFVARARLLGGVLPQLCAAFLDALADGFDLFGGGAVVRFFGGLGGRLRGVGIGVFDAASLLPRRR